MLFSIVAYLLVGLLAGLLGGLLGIGGGSITVPALFFLFSFLDFPPEHLMHIAIGTSLASMVINTFSSLYFHNKKKAVLWKVLKKLSLGLLIGSLLGALTARFLSTALLKSLFGVFACLIALYIARPIKVDTDHRMPSTMTFSGIGTLIAFLSNILGLGGGIFMVPTLSYYHFDTKAAIGTSAAVSFFVSLYGAAGYLVASIGEPSISGCLGYIYLPAFILISVSSFIFAAYGAKLAHKLPVAPLRKIFAGVMIMIGISMIFSGKT